MLLFNVINLRAVRPLSGCYEAVAIAWRSDLDDLNEAKRQRAQLFEQSEFWARSVASLDHLGTNPQLQGVYNRHGFARLS
jgi:hypothetical protein